LVLEYLIFILDAEIFVLCSSVNFLPIVEPAIFNILYSVPGGPGPQGIEPPGAQNDNYLLKTLNFKISFAFDFSGIIITIKEK
jgi:hypothetical protein